LLVFYLQQVGLKMAILEHGFSFGGALSEIFGFFFKKKPLPSGLVKNDLYWMKKALSVAMRGIGSCNPNPAVGCVVIYQDKCISEGFTQAYRHEHAERMAFQALSEGIFDLRVFVTLEPCGGTGHQPACADLLIQKNVGFIQIGRKDPHPKASSIGLQKLCDAKKDFSLGLLHNEITAWNFDFLASLALKRPVFHLKWAQTLDGQMADDFSCSHWISNDLSRAYTHWLRLKSDVIAIGARSFLHDQAKLNVRGFEHVSKHQPMRLILDPKGLCKEKDLFLEGTKTCIFSPFLNLEKENLKAISIPQDMGLQGLVNALPGFLCSKELTSFYQRPIQSVFVEGGPQTLSAFFKASLDDVLHVFIGAKITAGKKHRLDLSRKLFETNAMKLVSSFPLQDDSVQEFVSSDLAGLFSPSFSSDFGEF
jgi:diaminohydroxyphosphoribosylaminopyrimidine deaminase/5-amino-6-(5-phosphoribosylamino)uracil reductase